MMLDPKGLEAACDVLRSGSGVLVMGAAFEDQAWAARISDGNGGKISLGNHADEVSAALAYDRAARELHGEFAILSFPAEA